ncbi:MAG: hypothetical protein MUD14_24910 [Hydrococcus sp. Prado102]|jgi:hypothetical protein|nr:hypothetical protein [Hydrococcus sp. Prado102]
MPETFQKRSLSHIFSVNGDFHFMWQNAQGIPDLPDLTHPQELISLGQQLLGSLLTISLVVSALGVAIALLSFALNRYEVEGKSFLGEWVNRYSSLLKAFLHGILVLTLLVVGFLFCSTLANRYHHWEQASIAKIAASVEGEKLEQPAPKVRYVVEEPYSYFSNVDGKLVKVQDTQQVNRFLALTSSEIQVNIDQIRNLQVSDRNNYRIDFAASYQFTNSLPQAQEIFFEISPPYSYSLLQNFRVEQEGKRLEPTNPGSYSFPLRLAPQQSTSFRVMYQAQGAPRWVYSASGELLSNFRLTVNANFPNADFASGIAPTEIKNEEKGTVFIWVFEDNVSVANPFGVFTSTAPVLNTGILPRLLLLAPGVFLWWLLLLYLSLPMTWRNVALAGALFFACILALTYLSRIMDVRVAWSGISLVLSILVWGLGTNRNASLAAIICTISGAILPVLALIISYSGITLSLAGLLSVTWLVVRNWYAFSSDQ